MNTPTNPTPLSACCHAPLRISGSTEGTNYHVCTACGKAADVVPNPTPTPRTDGWQPPDDIVKASHEIDAWMQTMGCHDDWRLGPCASRKGYEKLLSDLAASRAECEKWKSMFRSVRIEADDHTAMCVRIWAALGEVDPESVHEIPCDVQLANQRDQLRAQLAAANEHKDDWMAKHYAIQSEMAKVAPDLRATGAVEALEGLKDRFVKTTDGITGDTCLDVTDEPFGVDQGDAVLQAHAALTALLAKWEGKQ